MNLNILLCAVFGIVILTFAHNRIPSLRRLAQDIEDMEALRFFGGEEGDVDLSQG